MITVGSLFSGIGGFDLGLERAGMQIVWQSEVEPYCCKVLKKHWTDIPNFGDIFKIHNPPAVDLICGGFPCQPFSVAGKRQGKADDRYLWPEMFRIITEVKPRWVFAENVPGIIYMELDQVLSDLESEGYETATIIIPACALNAPHRRNRIWIVAHSRCWDKRQRREPNEVPTGRQGKERSTGQVGRSDCSTSHTEHDRCHRKKVCVSERGSQQAPIDSARTDRHAPDTNRFYGNDAGHGAGEISQFKEAKIRGCHAPDSCQPRSPIGLSGQDNGQEGNSGILDDRASERDRWQIPWPEVATRLCRVDDGLPTWVHRHRVKRLKALGNAIIPQIAEVIGRMIIEVDRK